MTIGAYNDITILLYNPSLFLYNPSLFLYNPSLFQIRPQPFPLQGQPAPNTRLAFSSAKSILFFIFKFHNTKNKEARAFS
jgi:hypothetical protein